MSLNCDSVLKMFLAKCVLSATFGMKQHQTLVKNLLLPSPQGNPLFQGKSYFKPDRERIILDTKEAARLLQFD